MRNQQSRGEGTPSHVGLSGAPVERSFLQSNVPDGRVERIMTPGEVCSESLERETACWRVPFMHASVVGGVSVSAITELLSLFNAITYVWVSAVWGLVTLVAAASCFVVLHIVKPTIRLKFSQLAYPEWLLLLWIGFIVATTGVT